MKEKRRLHIHISVENLEESIAFYNIQFGTSATKVKEDYAQWLLDDMSLNFAISTRGYEKGLNHLGLQYESDEALLEAQHNFEKAGIKGKVENGCETISPYGIWTGSFNLTKNATASLKNALYITDNNIVQAYFKEYGQIAAMSEELDWTSDWTAPEWRIGT